MKREMVGLAAELAVASELCRRNVYAQLTFGHQKRTDLLIFSEHDELLRIEVKGKQGREWPNCKGIFGKNVIMVLVDFAGKKELERPDFYMLTVQDWVDFALGGIERARASGKRVVLDEHNVPTHLDEVNARGEPYRGFGIRSTQVQQHNERWDKITEILAKQETSAREGA